MRIVFTVNGVPRQVEAPPLRRLIDILREDLGLTGTKEGCGEGECGACAVLLDGALVHSCLVPAAQLPGRSVRTIEDRVTDGKPDTVQRAFLEEGAVQCGFCIPGMVMASRALLARDPAPTEEAIREGLSGNICRCTGYERIVRAVQSAAGVLAAEALGKTVDASPSVSAGNAATASDGGRARAAVRAGSDPIVLSPATLDEALSALAGAETEHIVVAGGTDLMLPSSREAIVPRAVVDLARIDALAGVRLFADRIEIGATTTAAALLESPIVREHLPALAEAARLFGAPAIRNRATLGGNLAGASPAADFPPALLALGASVVLASTGGTREVPLEAFFTGYRRTVRRAGELIVAVRVPRPAAGARQAFFKAGTRRAQSIARASVAGAARVDGAGTLRDVRLAAGSVAPIPILLAETMRCVEGRPLDGALIDAAERQAALEATPIDDVRSDIAYRRHVTGRLVARFLRMCGPA